MYVASWCSVCFVLFCVFVFVRAVLPWCPQTAQVYIVYNNYVFFEYHFNLYCKVLQVLNPPLLHFVTATKSLIMNTGGVLTSHNN